ncbi:hypothetical protein [Breoghania sp.]|uniref:hypothetical protein n=1 Tax=Breoghania sp. TaxID=2065378 RepID=UPI0026268D3C|nr:hypothetical protein [Breoghania sp.]MDJ0932563.1 hypothetical protein [Breoghania sp.]
MFIFAPSQKIASILAATTFLTLIGISNTAWTFDNTVSGDVILYSDDPIFQLAINSGTITASVSGMGTGIVVYPTGTATGPLDVTLDILSAGGTTDLYRSDDPAVAVSSTIADTDFTVNIENGVSILSDHNFGAV